MPAYKNNKKNHKQKNNSVFFNWLNSICILCTIIVPSLLTPFLHQIVILYQQNHRAEQPLRCESKSLSNHFIDVTWVNIWQYPPLSKWWTLINKWGLRAWTFLVKPLLLIKSLRFDQHPIWSNLQSESETLDFYINKNTMAGNSNLDTLLAAQATALICGRKGKDSL